ncbi:hypothetical protein SH501x_000993 [Pirellulaceae bacterium SH501]
MYAAKGLADALMALRTSGDALLHPAEYRVAKPADGFQAARERLKLSVAGGSRRCGSDWGVHQPCLGRAARVEIARSSDVHEAPNSVC